MIGVAQAAWQECQGSPGSMEMRLGDTQLAHARKCPLLSGCSVVEWLLDMGQPLQSKFGSLLTCLRASKGWRL